MTAFEEGKKARLKGKPLSANPYGDLSGGVFDKPATFDEWAEGWKAMQDVLVPKPKPREDNHLGSSRE